MTELEKICSYFERNAQLHVLFIFDNRMLADTLKDVDWGHLGLRYEVFNGSWFKTKYNIYHDWADDKIILLFPNRISPMGNNEEMKKFPLLDVLVANMEYKPTSYEQFMQEYNLPIQFAEYISRHVDKLDSQQIKKILLSYYTPEAFTTDVANRGIISHLLGQDRLLDWTEIVVRTIIVSNTEKKGTYFKNLYKDKDLSTSLDNKLKMIFNTSVSYNKEDKMQDVVEMLKYNAITQSFTASKDDPYKSLKNEDADKIRYINAIVDFALSNTKLTKPFMDVVNFLSKRIHENEIIRVYGADADYHFIDASMSYPIIKSILKDILPDDPDAVLQKISLLETRISTDIEEITSILDYIEKVALLKRNLKLQSGISPIEPDEFIQQYLGNRLYKSDMYYRLSLESYGKINCQEQELDDMLKKLKAKTDEDYIYHTNVLNRKWIETLVKHQGFSKVTSLNRQQDFYPDYVENSNGKTVVIIVDALRYELAQELMLNLAKDHNTADIYPCLAMVPTETKYCMSALLPHNTIDFNTKGIVVDGKIVDGITPRSKYLGEHVPEAEVLDFETVYKFKDDDGKQYFTKQRPLTYIIHKAIDELCHPSPSAEDVTSTCRIAIDKIRTLVRKLHNSWYVNRVIITADHGFVYNDVKIEGTNLTTVDDEIYGGEKDARHYLTESDKEITVIAKFPLSEVSAFNEKIKVGTPYGTMRLSGHSGYNFAHGGASLQEVIIPVIVSSLVKETTVQRVDVKIIEPSLSVVSSTLKFNLIQTEPISMEHRERKIMCALYDNDKLVSDEVIKTLDSSEELPAKRIVPILLKVSSSSSLLKIKIFNIEKDSVDYLNPLIIDDVTNNTLIERDDF